MAASQVEAGPLTNVGRGPGKILKSGIAAGIIGGTLMAMIMMIATAMGGMGLLAPLRLIAATLYGKDAMMGGGPLVVGMMVHMMNSIMFGVIFAWLAGRLATGAGVMAGVSFGIAIWAIMTLAGLPSVNPMMAERVAMMPLAWFIAHVVFGMGVGAAPVLRRRLAAA